MNRGKTRRSTRCVENHMGRKATHELIRAIQENCHQKIIRIKMKHVAIDQDECINCGACVELCPEIFALDENEEKAYVTTPDSEDTPCIEEAIASCPTSCISFEEK